MKRVLALAGIPVAAIAAVAFVRYHQSQTASTEPTECCREFEPQESAGICPWRRPEADRVALFPHSDSAEQRLLALSDLRPEILKRLGKGGVTDGNALYVYRVFRGSQKVGVIMVQRAPGQYGAVEYVVGMTPEGRIVGVRIQSQRETPAIARAIDAPAWRQAFVGKGFDAAFEVGADLPMVPAEAQKTAAALAASIRRLVIETTVGLAHGRV